MREVIVVGGGASGMIAAITAAENAENHVILLERQQRVGRKLMATGNGRCNLTNTTAGALNYHGAATGFVYDVLSEFPPAAALDFFHSLGLLTVEEYGGRVYPLSDSANSVVDVLRFALDKAGVEQKLSSPVRRIKHGEHGFSVSTEQEKLCCDTLIIACGGAAGAKLGGVMDGYQLLGSLGHRCSKLSPSLVQLLTDTEYPRALKGVRADAALELFSGAERVSTSVGELQFTDKGVSGPAVFDISRQAAENSKGLELSVDFLRSYGADTVMELLIQRAERFPLLPAQELFTGMLHNRLGRMLVKYAKIPFETALVSLTMEQLSAATYAAKSFRLTVLGTEGFDNAQVTAGGVLTKEFDSKTLESHIVPLLFACGEVLDVDGDCGGYNLQWAWASGRVAGRLGKCFSSEE